VKMEAEIGVIGLQAKNTKICQQPQEAKKRSGSIVYHSFQRHHGPATVLIVKPPELHDNKFLLL
jgi:hypothetical protein